MLSFTSAAFAPHSSSANNFALVILLLTFACLVQYLFTPSIIAPHVHYAGSRDGQNSSTPITHVGQSNDFEASYFMLTLLEWLNWAYSPCMGFSLRTVTQILVATLSRGVAWSCSTKLHWTSQLANLRTRVYSPDICTQRCDLAG